MLTCSSCGRENPDGFRFCGSCGTSLEPAEESVRTTVTVLFADVVESTALAERLDPESVRSVMQGYFAEARSVLERHGGTVEKFIGDAVVAVFGVPVMHEDDALRAVRAAVDLRDAVERLSADVERTHGVTLAIRTGINTGDVVAGDPASRETFVAGDAVNVAARLQGLAGAGEIVVAADTVALVRDAVRAESLGRVELRGRAEPIAAYRLDGLVAGAAPVARHLDSPMVGRDAELQRLLEAFAEASAKGACRLVTVLGPAGMGKSRLVEELIARLAGSATILRGRCLPYGEGITFWPIAEIVRTAAAISESDTGAEARAKVLRLMAGVEPTEAALIEERVSAAIGLGGAGAGIHETFWAVRRLLETLATGRPVVVIVEDIHWAEATLLDLLDYVRGFSHDHPILVVCTARPELRDTRPDWGRGSASVVLAPLEGDEAGRLVGNLLGDVALPRDVRERILSRADGNPLFVEEMLRMLIDEGLLRRTNGHFETTGDLSAVSPPRSIQALIGARLGRLDDGERAVIHRASVVGRVFYWGAVAELSTTDARPSVGSHLQALLRKELIEPEASSFAGQDAFRFSHVLVRDSAYESIPKRTRAELHERFAFWLEQTAAARLPEYEEIVGHHLEQAYRQRRDLGVVDEHGSALARRAADHAATAGRRALARGDMLAADKLLSRALDLLDAHDPVRAVLLTDLGKVLFESGHWDRAGGVLDDAIEGARASGDRGAEGVAEIRSTLLGLFANRWERNADAIPAVERAIATFEELGHEAGLAEGWIVLGSIQFWSGAAGTAVTSFERAIEHARRAGAEGRLLEALRLRSMAETWGPTPVHAALQRLDELAASAEGHSPFLRSAAARLRAILLAMRGEHEAAMAAVEEAKATSRELGLEVQYAAGALRSAIFVAMQVGDLAGAESAAREAVDVLRRIGDLGHLSSVAPELADVLLQRGASEEEAMALTEEGERATIGGDVDAEVRWRAVRARILARQGRLDEAVTLANDAVARARATDYLDLTGEALEALSEVLPSAVRPSESAAALREAATVYEQKGALAGLQRVRARLEELESATG